MKEKERMKMMKRFNKKGFTLVEILATVTILAILMSVAVGAVYMYSDRTKQQGVETIASSAYDGMVNYMMHNNMMLNVGESFSLTLAEIYDAQFMDRPTDPYNNAADCSGTVKVTNQSTSATTGLDDYKYEVHVDCTGNHDIDKTYPKE